MRAINHALTGSVIGLTVGVPVVAIPLAIISHFVCDTLPHHGSHEHGNTWLQSHLFRVLLFGDALLCLGLVALLALGRPLNWELAVACAFLAAAPDLLSLNRYVKTLGNRDWRPGLYAKFAIGIQWFERPIGAAVEVSWFVAALVLLIPFIR